MTIPLHDKTTCKTTLESPRSTCDLSPYDPINGSHPSMTADDFQRFSEFIYNECGINLTANKKTMLTARLSKRLAALDLSSYSHYYDFIQTAEGRAKELVHMIDLVTTNKTDFFREADHFDTLQKTVLPDLLRYRSDVPFKRLNVWSAGCSSGEEPYTLAMVIQDYFEKSRVRGDYSILASDISTRILKFALKGIYGDDVVEAVPSRFKQEYLMRGKGSQKGYCRIVPELRNRVTFQRINLIESRDFDLKSDMDVIFCRNVIIYFDRRTQMVLFEKFYNQLKPGGYLFIGHCETLNGINDRFQQVAVSVYRKPE